MYIAFESPEAITNIDRCFQEVQFTFSGLSLDPDKSEAMIIETSTRQRTEGAINSISLGAI
jgi:hypothetical protein